MSWIAWIVVGLLAGALARWVLPGRQPGGLLLTIVIGIAGGVLGGWAAGLAGFSASPDGINFASIGTSFVGAVMLLMILEAIGRRD